MNEQEIKILLIKAGISFSDIDKKYSLSRGTARLALNMPNKKGEKAVAKILNMRPKDIWKDRYDKKGNRLKPQPNYYYKKTTHLHNENNFKCVEK